jgi:hypothetical protein
MEKGALGLEGPPGDVDSSGATKAFELHSAMRLDDK